MTELEAIVSARDETVMRRQAEVNALRVQASHAEALRTEVSFCALAITYDHWF